MPKNVSQNDLDKCIVIYDAMRAASKNITRDGFTGDVYAGRLTYLFSEMGIAMPYYTPVMNALKEMGCVQQLRRGGGSSPSEWALFFPPTNAEFKAVEKKSNRTGLKQSPMQVLEQQNRDLKIALSALDNRVKLLELILTHDKGKSPEELILDIAEEEEQHGHDGGSETVS